MMSLAAWMMHATEEFSQAPRPEMDEERLFTTLNYDMFQGFQSDMAVANSESLNDIAGDSKRYIPGDVWEQCVTAMGPVPRRDFLFQRKSVAAAVGPDELQDLFVAAAFNSVGALPTVVTFGSGDPDAASLKPLFVHVVKTLRACEGALLQMADHEERWNSDVADIALGTKKVRLLGLLSLCVFGSWVLFFSMATHGGLSSLLPHFAASRRLLCGVAP